MVNDFTSLPVISDHLYYKNINLKLLFFALCIRCYLWSDVD